MADEDLVPKHWIRRCEFVPRNWRKDINDEYDRLIEACEEEYGITLTRQRHLGALTYYYGYRVLQKLDAESALARLKYLGFKANCTEMFNNRSELFMIDGDPQALPDDENLESDIEAQ